MFGTMLSPLRASLYLNTHSASVTTCTTFAMPFFQSRRRTAIPNQQTHDFSTTRSQTPLSMSSRNVLRKAPPRRPTGEQRRNFFGLGEVIGVIANPAETLRSLSDARRLLEETRTELAENRERASLRPSHTFSRLPGFFPRNTELKLLERTLDAEPAFTVLFGASSVGKTALLRQLLSSDRYHVLHFDLRIAGFADLESLYMSLSQQMEQYFGALSEMEGYKEFEKEGWSFKHDRRSVEQRLADDRGGVRTSDIARLMELFQSSLLKYREFVPKSLDDDSTKDEVTHATISSQSEPQETRKPSWWRLRRRRQHHREQQELQRQRQRQQAEAQSMKEKPKREPPPKRMPVLFFDEAHKLPGLIQSVEAMKCLLDSMLVLTKQDRLCHVIHSTSDPFYQTWLRQLNVMQHCKIVTIGDCSMAETRGYFERNVLPGVPENLRHGLDFEEMYDAFGGRLVHWQDYSTDYVNSGGKLRILQSSHFVQAHALLNLHVIHSSRLAEAGAGSRRNSALQRQDARRDSHAQVPAAGGGFSIYSPLSGPPRNPHAAPTGATPDGLDAPSDRPSFTGLQLLRVLARLTEPGVRSLSYFMLCREFGARAIDGMVRGRILDLRWTEPVTREDAPERRTHRQRARRKSGVGAHYDALESPTLVDQDFADEIHREGDAASPTGDDDGASETADEGFVVVPRTDADAMDPRILPATPILRFAMAHVVAEYEDSDSVSEYASLSDADIDEY
ncbi:unnamed protein product [Peniophora sp. CBMAI 1063]|nr:unnamed protein product [Peniophora sp. CBMAI 1063]